MEDVVKDDETAAELEAEGTDLTPVEETTDSGITLESLHALVLELQGTVANLQAVADQATPVEPNAEEPAETPDESALLEDEPASEEVSEEDLEEVDALLQAN